MTESRRYSILVSAGEVSGDAHAAELVAHLKELGNVRIFGIGGDRMGEAGVDLMHHIRDMAFMGFFEVVKHLPRIFRIFRSVVRVMEEKKPDLVLLVDYPGFNLRVAAAARRRGIPVVYYISPQVWAWGAHRRTRIARTVDRMLVLFSFEEELYREKGLDTIFVGHPLRDTVRPRLTAAELSASLTLQGDHPIVALLPGSRAQEVETLLPVMRDSYLALKEVVPSLQAVVARSPSLSAGLYVPLIEGTDIISASDMTWDVLAHCTAAMVASGTATLEAALLGAPMAVVYKISPVSYGIGRMIVRVPHIGLANIVAGKEIVPEFIQHNAVPEKIVPAMLTLIQDTPERRRMKKELSAIAEKLGSPGASRRAAEHVMDMLESL